MNVDTLQRMIEAAMKKAVEIGMLQKYAGEEQYLRNWANMKEIVEAAIYAYLEDN